jgi:hypothetical protein
MKLYTAENVFRISSFEGKSIILTPWALKRSYKRMKYDDHYSDNRYGGSSNDDDIFSSYRYKCYRYNTSDENDSSSLTYKNKNQTY